MTDRPQRRSWVDVIRIRNGLRRSSVPVVASVFVATGCGSATGQQVLPKSTAGRAGSTATATAPLIRPHKISRRQTHSGITGQAFSSACVVPSAGGHTCPRHPVRATIELLRAPSEHQIAVIETDEAGRFEINVPPGEYQLRARTAEILLFAPPMALRVRSDQFERVTVSFFLRHPLPVRPATPA